MLLLFSLELASPEAFKRKGANLILNGSSVEKRGIVVGPDAVSAIRIGRTLSSCDLHDRTRGEI
jgi:hypothetical protein